MTTSKPARRKKGLRCAAFRDRYKHNFFKLNRRTHKLHWREEMVHNLYHLDAGLWDQFTLRQKLPGSPHQDTQAIILRGPREITPNGVFNDLESVWWPAWNVIWREVEPALHMLLAEFCPRYRLMGASVTWGRIMLTKLPPGGYILPHADEGEYAKAHERFHIPYLTNPYVKFACEGEFVHMGVGDVWWFDARKRHWVKNEGDTDRIHLIVDVRNPAVQSAPVVTPVTTA